MMAARREDKWHQVTLPTTESDSLDFDNQTVKKLPHDQARERGGSSDVISGCTRRVRARGFQGHPYYSPMKCQCTQVRRNRQCTRGPTSR
jgi:hypothetical protein